MQFELVDIILGGFAAFWAISLLARMMNEHREQRVIEFRKEIQSERARLERQAEEQSGEGKDSKSLAANSLTERRMNRLRTAAEPSDSKQPATAMSRPPNGEDKPDSSSNDNGDVEANPESPATQSAA